MVEDILYMTVALNSCINPFIYGLYYYPGTLAFARYFFNVKKMNLGLVVVGGVGWMRKV